MKRNFVMLFSIVFIFSFITACSSNDEKSAKKESDGEVKKEGFTIVDEKLTMTMIAPGTEQSRAWEEMDVIQEYAEKTKIDFKFNNPPADNFCTNLNITYNSVSLVDIFYVVESDELSPDME